MKRLSILLFLLLASSNIVARTSVAHLCKCTAAGVFGLYSSWLTYSSAKICCGSYLSSNPHKESILTEQIGLLTPASAYLSFVLLKTSYKHLKMAFANDK